MYKRQLFEYLAVRKYIFCLGPEKGDVAHIINNSKSGITLEYGQRDLIKQNIKSLYEKWKDGQLDTPLDSQIEEYSHPNLTRKLATYLDEISA